MTSRNDKLFQRRKAVGKEELKRKKHFRKKRRRILIVTEGEVTEPRYFEFVRNCFELTSVDIDICGDCDSSPIDVVQCAKRKAEIEGPWDAGGYDQIYCVFDRDTHTTFERARSMVQELNKSKKFPAKQINDVCSFPCFEFWLLLHFTYSRAAFVREGNQSPCDMACRALKNAAGDQIIDKALTVPFMKTLMERLDQAIESAKKCLVDVEATGEPNPSTTIHLLVEDLKRLKQEIEA